MADQPSIFNESQEPTKVNEEVKQPQSQENDLTTLLSSIKNEKGEPKYRDVTEAFKGLQNAQEYIPQLKEQVSAKDREIEDMRKEVERLKEVEASVLQLTREKETQNDTRSNDFTPEKIEEIVAQTLNKRKSEETFQANIEQVRATLLSEFGSDAEKQLYSKAEELGLTREEINQLAATKPKVVFTMLGITGQGKQKPASVTSGTLNTSAFQPQKESFIGRNPVSALLGATTQQMQDASHRANKMVDEVHAQGYSMHDLSDPKVYNKIFNK